MKRIINCELNLNSLNGEKWYATINMPKKTKILQVHTIYKKPYLLTLIDTNINEYEDRYFEVLKSSQLDLRGLVKKFIGIFQYYNESFIIFEIYEPRLLENSNSEVIKDSKNELYENFKLVYKSLQEMIKLIDTCDYYNDTILIKAKKIITYIDKWLLKKENKI